MLTAFKFSIMKHKAFPCGNSFGTNLQYNEKNFPKDYSEAYCTKANSTPLDVWGS